MSPEKLTQEVVTDKPREACGVVGFISHAKNASELAYQGIISVQNRGEDGAGIALFDGQHTTVVKGQGEASEVFKDGRIGGFDDCKTSLGHVHYSTDEADPERSLQPYYFGDFSFAHNGQFTNMKTLSKHYGINQIGASDSELAARILAKQKTELGSIENALEEILPKLSGAFSFVIMEEDKIIAARDRRGLRPLSVGKLADGGYGVSSESAVFDIIDGEKIGDVAPGSYVVLRENSLKSTQWILPRPATCGLEYAYFSRADSEIDGVEVAQARKDMGRFLAEDKPADGDVVIPIPNSGRQAAKGFSEESGINYEDGFYRNDSVGRTYINAGSSGRKAKARLKNNPIKSVVKGKKVVVVDDSIVRGNTARETLSRLRDIGGAEEVHLRSTFPPIRYTCHYGMNMRQRDGLVAVGKTEEEIAKELGVDSLGYLSTERFEEAAGKVGKLCLACVTGEYPEPIDEDLQKEDIANIQIR